MGAGGLWTLCEESWYGGRGRGAAVILTATVVYEGVYYVHFIAVLELLFD